MTVELTSEKFHQNVAMDAIRAFVSKKNSESSAPQMFLIVNKAVSWLSRNFCQPQKVPVLVALRALVSGTNSQKSALQSFSLVNIAVS